MNLKKNITKMLLLLIISVLSIGTFNSKPAMAVNGSEPYVGQIGLFPYNFAPMGWMECNGQTLSIDQYQALYSLIRTNFGGNGTTTFQLPDLSNANHLPNANPLPNVKYYMATEGIYPSSDGGGSDFIMGTIALFPYDFAPGGWAYCDGTIRNIQSNQALFSLLSTNFGGNGTTTFQIPNLQNASPMNSIKYCICVSGIYPQRDYVGTGDDFLGSIDLYAFKYNQDECAGQTYNLGANSALFSLLGATYGGDGTSTFGIPDLRGAVPSPHIGYYIVTQGLYPPRS